MNNLLIDGINSLCQNNKNLNNLITPRREEVVYLLERYIKEIELFNSAYGLVGAGSTEELIIRHILDSLAPLGLISWLLAEKVADNNVPQIADAGSGAGLPGIPLAIALPDCNFTLIERMGRRAGFLCSTKAVLSAYSSHGLSNITVEEKELEKITEGRFNLVTFRAFKPLEPKLLKTLRKTLKPGGVIAAYKGKRKKIEQEMSELKIPALSCKWEAIPYSVPFLDEERHLLIVYY